MGRFKYEKQKQCQERKWKIFSEVSCIIMEFPKSLKRDKTNKRQINGSG